MKKIVFATGNEGKMREVRQILADLDVEILSQKEAGISIDVEEDGETFEANALIKVRAIRELAPDAIILADDSGIEIDAFDGGPGVHSARWMGHDTPYEEKNARILEMMKDKQGAERAARYVCAIAAAFPDGTESTVIGYMEGEMAHEASGTGGFGYDPIFYVPEYGKTSADLTPDEKNAISHRGKALRLMKPEIEKFISK